MSVLFTCRTPNLHTWDGFFFFFLGFCITLLNHLKFHSSGYLLLKSPIVFSSPIYYSSIIHAILPIFSYLSFFPFFFYWVPAKGARTLHTQGRGLTEIQAGQRVESRYRINGLSLYSRYTSILAYTFQNTVLSLLIFLLFLINQLTPWVMQISLTPYNKCLSIEVVPVDHAHYFLSTLMILNAPVCSILDLLLAIFFYYCCWIVKSTTLKFSGFKNSFFLLDHPSWSQNY